MRTAIFLVPPMLLQFVFFAFVNVIREIANDLNGEQVLLIILVVLAVVDVGVNAIAMARFRRSRLILS